MAPRPATRTLTIASGGTTSNAVNIERYVVTGYYLPVALTGTTCTFTASPTQTGTYLAVKDSDANTVSIPTTASGAYGLSGAEADALSAQFWIKAVSAGAEATDRTITLLLK